jgi:hypothetical protein
MEVIKKFNKIFDMVNGNVLKNILKRERNNLNVDFSLFLIISLKLIIIY